MKARIFCHPACLNNGARNDAMLSAFAAVGIEPMNLRVIDSSRELALVVEGFADGSEKIRRFDGITLMVNVPKVRA